MLRGLVAALLVANLLALAWTFGWLDALPGGGRHPDREPERIERQVNADAVQLIAPTAASAALQAAAVVRAQLPTPPAGAAPTDAVASRPETERPQCLEAGPFAGDSGSVFSKRRVPITPCERFCASAGRGNGPNTSIVWARRPPC